MQSVIQPVVFVSLFVVAVCIIYLRSVSTWRIRTRGRPLPPGPKSFPVVGNTFNAPAHKPWIAYRDLGTRFGDIIHVRVLGQSIVVLNSAVVIDEYLEKRSAITSDRKQTPLIALAGCDLNLGFYPYGQWWRRHKRMFWQYFNARAVAQYTTTQRTTSHKFLKLLLRDPSCFRDHIRFTFSAAMLKILYDIDAADKNDKYIAHIDDALEAVSQGQISGKFLVERLPSLRHIPAWFPGAGFQKQFSRWRSASHSLKNDTFDYVEAAMERDEAPQCIVARELNLLHQSSADVSSVMVEKEIVRNVGAVAFEGGADTTFSTLQATFLAMSLHPDVIKKAHQELDKVVGPDRLPDFCDRDALVYVQAVVKESLRWLGVLPMGVPHRIITDDEFHGYFIPEGTLLMPNIWACMHDPEAYDNPAEFRPERFIKYGVLDPSVRDPSRFVFGFGRRMCPGRHFAEASLFINIASVLHVFDITPPEDEHGQPIEVIPEMTNGLISYPEDVRCTIKPRSAQTEALILSSV